MPAIKLHPNGQYFTTRRIDGRKRFFYFGRDRATAEQQFQAFVESLCDRPRNRRKKPSVLFDLNKARARTRELGLVSFKKIAAELERRIGERLSPSRVSQIYRKAERKLIAQLQAEI